MMNGVTSRTLSWPRLARTTPLGVAMALLSVGALAFFRQSEREECRSNLKQYALGILMYCQDYDELMPPMKTPDHVVNRVAPYVKQKSIFSCPTTNTRYLPNPALNYQNLADIDSPATMLLLRDAKPHTTEEGKSVWNVVYADGHAKQVATEPALGKPAPEPKRSVVVAKQLALLRKMRKQIEVEIRTLEAEQRRMKRRR